MRAPTSAPPEPAVTSGDPGEPSWIELGITVEFVAGGCKTKLGSPADSDAVADNGIRAGADFLGFEGGRRRVGSSLYSASSLLISDANSLFAAEIGVFASSMGGSVSGQRGSFVTASARRSPAGRELLRETYRARVALLMINQGRHGDQNCQEN